MRLTNKQKIILKCVIFGKVDGEEVQQSFPNIRELANIVPYETTRQSMLFSIKALEKKGLITRGKKEKRNERLCVPIMPTDKALDLINLYQNNRNYDFDDIVVE